jgi:hypothetical protein
MLSRGSNVCEQVTREVERAGSNGILVLPFRIENVAPSGALEYFISAPHWLDAFSPRWQDHLTRLSEAVRRLLETEYSEAKSRADERRRRKEPEKACRNRPGKVEATLGKSSVEAGTQLEKEEKIQVAEEIHLEGVRAGDIAGIKGGSPAGRRPLEVAKRAVIKDSEVGDIVGIKKDSL